jgi:hypothetical protein
MGKILALLGVVLIGLGVYGLASGFLNIPAIPNVAETIDASRYCREGETLDQENGATSYTPGQGYASTVQYYCVDQNGNRRDITDEFNENLVDSVSGIMSSFSGIFNFDMKNFALIGGGILLLIVGLIVGLRRSVSSVPVQVVGSLGGSQPVMTTTGRVVQVNGQDVIATPEVARYIQQAQAMSQFASAGTSPQSGLEAEPDLAGKLKQLEQARSAGLISPEEYDRLRQQILDQMK